MQKDKSSDDVFNEESENEQSCSSVENINHDFFDNIIKLAKVNFVINLFIYNYHK
jgi:hypothetical protein